MDINIQNSKIELIQWLTTLEDTTVIQKIIDLRKNESNEWWNNISDTEKESIKKGISEAEEGKLNTQSEAQNIYKKWL